MRRPQTRKRAEVTQRHAAKNARCASCEELADGQMFVDWRHTRLAFSATAHPEQPDTAARSERTVVGIDASQADALHGSGGVVAVTLRADVVVVVRRKIDSLGGRDRSSDRARRGAATLWNRA